MEYRKEVGLNNYETFFFRRVFGTNIKRLMAFRKAVMKRQNEHGHSDTCEHFFIENEKCLRIYMSKKKVDAYIKLIKNEEQ